MGRMPTSLQPWQPVFFFVQLLVWTLCVRGQEPVCDASCQTAQQEALVSLYTATGGTAWRSTSALVHETVGWLNTSATATGLPAHCGWSGETVRPVLQC